RLCYVTQNCIRWRRSLFYGKCIGKLDDRTARSSQELRAITNGAFDDLWRKPWYGSNQNELPVGSRGLRDELRQRATYGLQSVLRVSLANPCGQIAPIGRKYHLGNRPILPQQLDAIQI